MTQSDERLDAGGMPAVLQGEALLYAIQAEAERQGVEMKDLYQTFEMEAAYWWGMCNGTKPVQSLSRHRLQLIANFLDKSLIEVMSLALLVQPEDFVVRSSIDDQLNLGFLKLKVDPMWAAHSPSDEEWDRTPRSAKILLIMMYERLYGITLIEKSKVVKQVVATTSGVPAKKTRHGTAGRKELSHA